MHFKNDAVTPGVNCTAGPDAGSSRNFVEPSELLHLIYATNAEPARWHDAVAAIVHTMEAMQVLLFTAGCKVPCVKD